MAEEIIFNVSVDTGDSNKELKNTSEGISDVGKAAKASNKEIDVMNARAKELRNQLAGLQKGTPAFDKIQAELEELTEDIKKAEQGSALLDKKFDDIYNGIQPLTGRIGELEDRLYELAAAGDADSEAFKEIMEELIRLKKVMIDVDKQIDVSTAKGAGLQAAFQLGEGVIAGFGAIQGITALVGQESEELAQTLVKLQGAQAALASIEQLRAITEAESALMIKGKILLEKAYALAVGESTGALKVFRLALIATGIGALVAVIAALIANWDELTGAISDSSIAAEGLTDTMEDYRKGAEEAVKQTSEVKVAFDLAREGVISKDEALKLYNDTLGDSFGKAKDLNEAEALYVAKTDAYIKATAMRKQADALLTKAAEEYAESLTANMEDQTSFWHRQIAGIQAQYGLYGEAQKTLTESQKEGVKEQEQLHKQRNSIFTDAAEQLYKDAETLEKANGIKSESEQALAEERKKLADEAAKKRQADLDKQREEEAKRLEEMKRLQREITDLALQQITDRVTRERMILAEKHRRELEDIRAQYGERAELIRALEQKQLIESEMFEQQVVEEAKLKHETDRAAEIAEEKQRNLEQIDTRKALYASLLTIAQENAQKQKAVDEALAESRMALVSAAASAIGQLAALAEEGSGTQKALALTEIAINTAVGFVNGLRIAQQSAAATGPAAAFAFPIFYAQQVAAVLAAANKAKEILKSGPSVSAPNNVIMGSLKMPEYGSVTGSSSVQSGGNVSNEPKSPMVPVLPIQSLKQVEGGFDNAIMIATWP